MFMSASVLTGVVTDDELLPGRGSDVDELTVAVLEIEPVTFEAMCTVTVIEAIAPAPIVALVQVTGPDAPLLQLNPAGATAETNVVPAGRLSVTTTLWASLGPSFSTAMAYEKFSPAYAEPSVDFAIDRSADEMTVADVELLLLRWTLLAVSFTGRYLPSQAIVPVFPTVAPFGVLGKTMAVTAKLAASPLSVDPSVPAALLVL
jgi:hypothetical protein